MFQRAGAVYLPKAERAAVNSNTEIYQYWNEVKNINFFQKEFCSST